MVVAYLHLGPNTHPGSYKNKYGLNVKLITDHSLIQ
jgi:hypothetical protein